MNTATEGLKKCRWKTAWLLFHCSADILVLETQFFFCQFLKIRSKGFKSILKYRNSLKANAEFMQAGINRHLLCSDRGETAKGQSVFSVHYKSYQSQESCNTKALYRSWWPQGCSLNSTVTVLQQKAHRGDASIATAKRVPALPQPSNTFCVAFINSESAEISEKLL